jgi:hypothetical protein
MKQNLHADMSKIALAKYLPWSTHYDEAYCTEREFGKYLHPKYKETKNLVKTKLSRLKNSDTDSDSEHFSGDGHTTTEEKLISSSEEETQEKFEPYDTIFENLKNINNAYKTYLAFCGGTKRAGSKTPKKHYLT